MIATTYGYVYVAQIAMGFHYKSYIRKSQENGED